MQGQALNQQSSTSVNNSMPEVIPFPENNHSNRSQTLEKTIPTQPTIYTSPTNGMDVFRLGEILAQSGYFSEARGAAQAVVKILAGMELGFGPIASMTGIFIDSRSGKPCMHANMMAARIKMTPGLDYEILRLDNSACEIAIKKHGKTINPTVSFTIEDAQQAGLLVGKNAHTWKKYARNMLFARCISNAAKWHCPELYAGITPYVPEEFDIDAEQDLKPPISMPEDTHPTSEVLTKDQERILELLESPVFTEDEITMGIKYAQNGRDPQKFIERLEYILQERAREPESEPAPSTLIPTDADIDEIETQLNKLTGLKAFEKNIRECAERASGKAYYDSIKQADKYRVQVTELTNQIMNKMRPYLDPSSTAYQDAIASFQEAFNLKEPTKINHFFHILSCLVVD